MVKIVRVLHKVAKQIVGNNGVSYGPLPEDIAEDTNLTVGADCTIAKVETKHGLAVMIWADDQPPADEYGEEL
ncbi:hypothetical protein [Halomontanus rarus]|uniref:hypothetical protein n=1 Tax=Halomontanus rarus TaxID=3034020 RepID=UPI001A98DB40